MNHLILHIEYLLLRHECVIVPGLGAFIATTVPAKIDKGNGNILPPSRSVIFNQAVITDDGLLTNSIARRHDITFEEARQTLFKWVSSIKEQLILEGHLVLGRIGSFLMGEENTILFYPSDDSDSLSATPGMDIISYSPKRKGLLLEEGEATLREKGFWSGKLKKIAITAAAVAAIIIAGCLYPLPSDSREQKASVLPVESLFQSKKKKNVESREIKVALPDNNEGTIGVNNLKEEWVPKYYLIVATFRDQNDAENFAINFSTEELPLITVSSGKVTRVAVASSDNKEELQQRLNSHEISSHFTNPWIWEKV